MDSNVHEREGLLAHLKQGVAGDDLSVEASCMFVLKVGITVELEFKTYRGKDQKEVLEQIADYIEAKKEAGWKEVWMEKYDYWQVADGS